MTARGLPGRAPGRRSILAAVGLTALALLVLAPVVLAASAAPWVRWAPLLVGTLLAAAAAIALRVRRGRERVLQTALFAAALTVAIAGLLVQVGLIGAAALAVMTLPLVVGAVLWRARGSQTTVAHGVRVRSLVSGRANWPTPLGLAAMCIATLGVALVAVIAGPLPTLALTALLLMAVVAAIGRLAVPRIEARTLTAVLVALALAAVPFRGLAELQVSGIALGASDVLLLGALVVWIFGRGARVQASVPPYVLGLVVFAGWLTVTALVAVDPTQVLKEVLKWLQIAAALVILADIMREPGGRRIVAWTVGAAVLMQAGLGVVQTAAQAGPGGFIVGGFLRAFGTFDQPNPFGGYLGIHLPLILAAVIYARGSRRRWLALLGIVVLMGVVASRSRGAWLGLGASSLVVVLAAGRRTPPWARGVLALLAAGALALALAALFGLFDRALPPDITRTIQGEHPLDDAVRHHANDDFAIAQRVAHWAAGWRMFQDRPLLGVGAGNFDDAYRAFALHPFDEPLGHAHNVAINFGAEAGLLGMLMFAGLSLWAFWIAVAAVRRARGSPLEWSAVGSLGALVAFATHNMVDSLLVSGMGIVFAWLLALGLAVQPRRPAARSAKAPL